jgi:hypothetical protein
LIVVLSYIYFSFYFFLVAVPVLRAGAGATHPFMAHARYAAVRRRRRRFTLHRCDALECFHVCTHKVLYFLFWYPSGMG